MEDPPPPPAPPSEASTRRPKRGRPPKQPRKEIDADEEQVERESSPDDFDEELPIPKSKRNRATEGTANATLKPTDQTLLEAIKGNGKLIPHVVKLWVESYEKDPTSAMVELLTMLFEACGAKYHDKSDLMDEIDVDDVIVALVLCAQKGEVEDYQSSKKKEFKNFKENLESFWDNLVRECQHGPLFDQVLFDKCMDYIIALSCTPPRVFRQVASLMGLSLVTSYITIANMLGVQRETTRRQLDAEKKKKIEGPRMESLNKRFSDMHEKITLLEEMMRKIFTGLFVHRYRDVDPNIRMSCIESLGAWILSYPSLFLQDLYLKYLGWTLNDQNAGVRKASIRALQNLYETDDNIPTLSLFTERFSGRMIELADDIDVAVAVQAIGLVKQLFRHQLIPEDDLGHLYDLLIDDPPEIRHATGALVYDHLIAQKFNSSQSGSRGENDNSSKVHLDRMLQILEELPPNPIMTTYVIDDVWDYMKAMKDWKCIISMLLDENSSISDKGATNLVQLLCASVKKAIGERIVPAIDNRKQYHSKAQKEVFENNKQDITVAMMKNYPLLLRKFISDKAKVSLLVEIVLYMDLGFYSSKREEQNFKKVLQLMKEAFFKHGDKDPLRACVKAINFCCIESQGELQDFARNKLKELEDEIIAKLKSAIREVVDGGDEYSLLVNLRRLYELQLSTYVPIGNLYEDIVKVLRDFRNLEDEVIGLLLQNMHFHLAWSVQSIIDGESVSAASLTSLVSKRDALLQELEYFVNLATDSNDGGKSGSELAGSVCIMLPETWCLLKMGNFRKTELERLGYQPNAYVVQKFWELCQQQLNVSDEVEDDDVNKEYSEETNKCVVLIAACKLITSGIVPKDYLAPEIISHFVMHGADVADIVKHLITFLKKREDDWVAIFLEALKKAYQWHTVDSSGNDNISTENSFLECKNLAVQLSGTFIGAARNKHRSDILKLVKDGIEYAFVDAPKHLSFLEAAVVHCVSKLPAPDVLEIKNDVEKRTENVNKDENPSGWHPYCTFVEVLREKCAKSEVVQDEKEGVSVKRRGRPRKMQNMAGKKLFNDHSSSEDEDSISHFKLSLSYYSCSNPKTSNMSSNYNFAIVLSLVLFFFVEVPTLTTGELVQEQPLVLKYHNGQLLKGRITVNLIWYGTFTPIQRSIIVDFINSVSTSGAPLPSAATWWKTTEKYKTGSSALIVGKQFLHPGYSLGKNLKGKDLLALATKFNELSSITVVLTSKDVNVEGFCMSRCGTHGSVRRGSGGARTPYIWVGNAETLCPGQCAWPFHQPIYGPQSPPLVAPNGDVGVDGMIINLATLLAGTVTNPFNNGYFQGPATAPLEAVTACTGVFGSGAYPGYAGRVLVDGASGASYNAHGANGRKYLLPAMWDPQTSACKTLV